MDVSLSHAKPVTHTSITLTARYSLDKAAILFTKPDRDF